MKTRKTPKIRLYITTLIQDAQELVLSPEQSHYLVNVLRLDVGDELLVFDGVNGEFVAEIGTLSKKSCSLRIVEKSRDFYQAPDLWLLFAPVKKDKTDFIISGAVELGVRKLVPIISQYTITEKVKKERYLAQVIEAAEQSRRVDIPQVEGALPLDKVLDNWGGKRMLYFMDETGNGQTINKVFGQTEPGQSAAILVGPEGGFSEEELIKLRRLDFACGVSMGKRILRAETAVNAALACWQAHCGDWR